MKKIRLALLLTLLPVATLTARGGDAAKAEKGFSETFENQLRQSCPYSPNCFSFYPQAVKELGPFRGTFAFFDRITRSTTIGTTSFPSSLRGSDGLIHEGVEVYSTRLFGNAVLQKRSPGVLIQGNPFDCSRYVNRQGAGSADILARSIISELPFIDYLFANSLYDDAARYLVGVNFNPSDTLSYYRGLSLYSLRDFKGASECLSQVGKGSSYYDRSLFLGSVSMAYAGDYDGAVKALLEYDGKEEEIKNFSLASLYLVENDLDAYGRIESLLPSNAATELLSQVRDSRVSRSGKSPWLAAGASALVPGLGKIYAGRLDEGISSFLCVGTLAAFTAECYAKKGASDWRTILFGSLASLFYIGNVYGSYLSVGIYNETLFNAQNSTILFNLHIPVRNLVER